MSLGPKVDPVKTELPHFDDLTFNTTPNWLTVLRMAFAPLVVGLLFVGEPQMNLWAAVAFSMAAVTDIFDGYLARRSGLVTVYGKLMDPLADKFLVVSALVMLQQMGRVHPVVVIVLICREMAITGLRALASAEGVIIAASTGGKLKAITQMVGIPMIIAWDHLDERLPLQYPGWGLLYFSIAISLWSAKDYAVDFFRAAREKRRLRKLEKQTRG